MADTQPPTKPTADVRGSYIPVREGHPRFNLLLLAILLLGFLVFALVQAQRLAI